MFTSRPRSIRSFSPYSSWAKRYKQSCSRFLFGPSKFDISVRRGSTHGKRVFTFRKEWEACYPHSRASMLANSDWLSVYMARSRCMPILNSLRYQSLRYESKIRSFYGEETEISALLEETSPAYPSSSPQWMEDRFWVWVHYSATKLGRSELFELIDTITFNHSSVLGPLILMHNGHLPQRVRKFEEHGASEVGELKETFLFTILRVATEH